MKRIVFILFTLCFVTPFSFAQTWGTYLGRICEFDAVNAIGLMDSGNFVITAEHISYKVYEDATVDVRYRYTLKKTTQGANNTFGLSLRRRGQEGRRDEETDTLNIIVNGKKTQVAFAESPCEIYDENGKPIKINWDDEEEADEYFWAHYTGYIAWYYFNINFPESNEAEIEITYNTIFGADTSFRYSSDPFWIPSPDDTGLRVTVENNYNPAFLARISGCKPGDTLAEENWKLEKPKQNTVTVIYTPGWFSQNKEIRINFLDIHKAFAVPHDPYFDVYWDAGGSGTEGGIFLGSYYGGALGSSYDKKNNICLRELRPYELIFLNKWQLRLMRNAFYARHKYKFNDNELNILFYTYEGNGIESSVPADDWFNKNFTEETLAPMERRNIEIIQELENFAR